mgnify:CR=1 FL=1
MSYMFYQATSFNADISSWDVITLKHIRSIIINYYTINPYNTYY